MQVVEIAFSVSDDCTVLLCTAGDITVMVQVVVLSFSVPLYCTVLICTAGEITLLYHTAGCCTFLFFVAGDFLVLQVQLH